jgi:hypothetical protein
VDRHDWQVVKARYDEAIAALDARMGPERRQNLLQREALTREAEALVESEDLRGAAATARDLRAAWQVTVSSPQREEKQLWKRFHEAVEAVLGREHEARLAHRRNQDDNLARALALCQEVESLCQRDDQSLLAAQGRARQLLQEAGSQGPLPPKSRRSTESRIQHARETLETRISQAEQGLEDQRMQLLRRYAALCERLEQLALQGGEGSGDPAEIEQALSALPPLDDPQAREQLEGRLELARSMLREPGIDPDLSATLESNLERCRTLCLDLEILLGKESPECERETRLQHQVSMLSQAMSEGRREEPSQKAQRLMRELLLCGPLPAREAPALRKRLDRLVC